MTCRYRNKRAFKAWFWVEALTLSLVARFERKSPISGSPISSGGRSAWYAMNRCIQAAYVSAVLGL